MRHADRDRSLVFTFCVLRSEVRSRIYTFDFRCRAKRPKPMIAKLSDRPWIEFSGGDVSHPAQSKKIERDVVDGFAGDVRRRIDNRRLCRGIQSREQANSRRAPEQPGERERALADVQGRIARLIDQVSRGAIDGDDVAMMLPTLKTERERLKSDLASGERQPQWPLQSVEAVGLVAEARHRHRAHQTRSPAAERPPRAHASDVEEGGHPPARQDDPPTAGTLR